MTIELWNNGYVTTNVSDVDIFESNTCESNRIKWVTDLAAISRGKYESKRPEARYRALMKEAALGTPSRPFEFLPVVFDCVFDKDEVRLYNPNDQQFIVNFKHDYFHNAFGGPMGFVLNEKLYTNMRACVIAGIPYDKIPYNTPEQIQEGKFFAVRGKVPMFVWAQVPNTHIFLSKEAQSDRYAPQLSDYWLPEDFMDRLKQYCHDYKNNKEVTTDCLVVGPHVCLMLQMQSDKERIEFMAHISQSQITLLFKELGYKDELTARAMYYLKYKEFVTTGWGINPKTWDHLFNERNANRSVWKNGTQKETEQLVTTIKELYQKTFQ